MFDTHQTNWMFHETYCARCERREMKKKMCSQLKQPPSLHDDCNYWCWLQRSRFDRECALSNRTIFSNEVFDDRLWLRVFFFVFFCSPIEGRFLWDCFLLTFIVQNVFVQWCRYPILTIRTSCRGYQWKIKSPYDIITSWTKIVWMAACIRTSHLLLI